MRTVPVNKKYQTIKVNLTKDQLQALSRRTVFDAATRADVIRAAIDAYLADDQKKEKAR